MAKHSKMPLILALGTAVASLAFGRFYLRRYEEKLSGGERVPVLFVLKDVQRAQTLVRDDIGVREVPLAYVDDREVRSADLERVIGVETVGDVKAQQGLLWSDLAIDPGDRQVSRLIVPGKRAVPIMPGRVSSASEQLVRPGDYVDVIATLDSEQGSATAVVLLQRVIVLAVGSRTERKSDGEGEESRGSASRDRVITLSLDLQEAQLLALAQQRGQLSIALRHPDDQRIQQDVPELAARSLVEARKSVLERKSRISRPRPATTAPQPITEDE